ncbi:MAG: low-specificity L-threonine aldolase [Bacillota bacterium]|nr:low-specificity L-threonine aldolase [Bacillota bacterium]
MKINLRSDTVTKPTVAMRMAMMDAIVGDDVYEEDPTVIELEQLAATMLHKEAALFVPSGTFCNQLAIMTHTRRGDEILVGDASHILIHEVGAAAVLSQVQTRSLHAPRGIIDPEELRRKIRPDDIHEPPTGLICIENAHSAGTVVPLENMQEVYAIAREHQIPVHLDGARLFNAATALHVEAYELAVCSDSVNICLSKGLSAPIGSLLVGTEEFIRRARKNRKLMGGGMRQVGTLAAAGILSLKEMTKRLDIDHANARFLAEALADIPGIQVFFDRCAINMVFLTIDSPISDEEFVRRLDEKGFVISGVWEGEYRFVTHNDVTREDAQRFADSVREILTEDIV